MTKVLEKRVAALEQAAPPAAQDVAPASSATKHVWANPANAWLDELIGLHGDDPDVKDARRLGREYRERQPKC